MESQMTRPVKAAIVFLVLFVILSKFFSYRILNVPLGLTADEGAFAYNAVLLSKTLHDENNRFLPIFVLSLNGADWRQPVTQYYLTAFFRFFGSSVFNLRYSSVVITLVSAGLLYYLSFKAGGHKLALFSSFIFLTTPLIMIQSHLGLDNIMPVPFTIIWMLCVYLFTKTKQNRYLLLSGIFLGINFYTYKGMRATVPVWAILTAGYIFYDYLSQKNAANLKKVATRLIVFVLGILPFFAVIPLLEYKYAGAVFNNQGANTESVYSFVLPYLSSFDPSFLFIEGDATPWHSTGKHGMFLLATLPLALLGIATAIKKDRFWLFVVLAFFSAPLLYGFVNSVHRASRLMCLIPPYSLLAALGAIRLLQFKKFLVIVFIFLASLNYYDFVNYYWYQYPELSRVWFGDLSGFRDYQVFGVKSKQLGLDPYVDKQVASNEGVSGRYFEAAYVSVGTYHIDSRDLLPKEGILLSDRENIPGLTKLDVSTDKYYIHVRQ